MIESSTAPELHPKKIVSGHSDVARLLSLLAKQNSADTIQGSRRPSHCPERWRLLYGVAKPLSGDGESFDYPCGGSMASTIESVELRLRASSNDVAKPELDRFPDVGALDGPLKLR